MDKIAIFGCGALGSHIALNLARPKLEYYLIDDDSVENDNVYTTAFNLGQVGMRKVEALSNMLFDLLPESEGNVWTYGKEFLADGYEIEPVDLMVDCFDNGKSRNAVALYGQKTNTPLVHVGLTEERTGVIGWKEFPIVADSPRGEENAVCTNQLGQTIIQLTSALAAGAIRQFLLDGTQRSLLVTDRLRILE